MKTLTNPGTIETYPRLTQTLQKLASICIHSSANDCTGDISDFLLDTDVQHALEETYVKRATSFLISDDGEMLSQTYVKCCLCIGSHVCAEVLVNMMNASRIGRLPT